MNFWQVLGWILLAPIITVGLLDLYMWYRFARKEEVDFTASFMIWLSLKWAFALHTKMMAEKLPFISQDLTEMLGIRPDDGKIT